jgi:hypothetical protein
MDTDRGIRAAALFGGVERHPHLEFAGRVRGGSRMGDDGGQTTRGNE